MLPDHRHQKCNGLHDKWMSSGAKAFSQLFCSFFAMATCFGGCAIGDLLSLAVSTTALLLLQVLQEV